MKKDAENKAKTDKLKAKAKLDKVKAKA